MSDPTSKSSPTSAGTKYRFIGLRSPLSSSIAAPASTSSERTAPGGTSPPAARTTALKVTPSPPYGRSLGLPVSSVNLESECQSCKTLAACPLSLVTDTVDSISPCSDNNRDLMRETSFLDTPVRIATRDRFVALPRVSRSPSASTTYAVLASSANCVYPIPDRSMIFARSLKHGSSAEHNLTCTELFIGANRIEWAQFMVPGFEKQPKKRGNPTYPASQRRIKHAGTDLFLLRSANQKSGTALIG
jgi:hypothetical protein